MENGFKVGAMAKIPNPLSDNSELVSSAVKAKSISVHAEAAKMGRKISRYVLRFGYNGDDFINDQVTVVLDAFAIRVPRILLPAVKRQRNRKPKLTTFAPRGSAAR